MKKIISILLFGFICLANGVSAQDNRLDKFEGTWQWKSHDSIFTIVLNKVEFNGKKYDKDLSDSIVNVLIGWYELKVEGVIVSSSMAAKRKTFNYQKRDYTFLGCYNNIFSNIKKINLSFMIPDYRISNTPFSILPNGDAEWLFKKIPNVTPGVVVMKKIK